MSIKTNFNKLSLLQKGGFKDKVDLKYLNLFLTYKAI